MSVDGLALFLENSWDASLDNRSGSLNAALLKTSSDSLEGTLDVSGYWTGHCTSLECLLLAEMDPVRKQGTDASGYTLGLRRDSSTLREVTRLVVVRFIPTKKRPDVRLVKSK